MNKNIVIEVGVNQGQHTLGIQQKYDAKLYGFEPVPELLNVLVEKFKDNKNIEIYPYAIDIQERVVDFYLSDNDSHTDHQYGCSSMYQFSKNIHDVWPNRPDFKIKKSVKVQSTRLDTFIQQRGITRIEYIHCDAQGNDFNVLKSFGDAIEILQSGLVEVTNNIALYEGTNNNIHDVTKWLISRGFKIDRIKNSDHLGAESNLYFGR